MMEEYEYAFRNAVLEHYSERLADELAVDQLDDGGWWR